MPAAHPTTPTALGTSPNDIFLNDKDKDKVNDKVLDKANFDKVLAKLPVGSSFHDKVNDKVLDKDKNNDNDGPMSG